MMGEKGVQTRRRITQQALQLFSVKGYFNTGINDILRATGLTKGGLYGHFQSKEEIWYAVYDEALDVWRRIIFSEVRDSGDPLLRIEKTVENHLNRYLGADVFEGGCFFVNMLVELSGQSAAMSRHLFKGFVGFSRLIKTWLVEAEAAGMLRPQLDLKDVANFILIALNGAATFYIASRDPLVLRQTEDQLRFYIRQLRR
ncbi:MAG: TetR/AcrR family transcriptional regulator [Desulfobacterales bacterium]|nr:TetR/AcrR family transcriptional regulator [Desulfobacterales bacterium]